MNPFGVSRMRAALWRLGRKIYQFARREGAYDPRCNGEYWLLDAAIASAHPGELVVIDVGAHTGDWTFQARESLDRHGRIGTTYSFEPTPSTFEGLASRFSRDSSVRVFPLAVSETPGTRALYIGGHLAGTNSLVESHVGPSVQVEVTSVDEFLGQHEIDRVAILKSDTEGHDLAVLRGGAKALADGRIDLWQFEYNHRWIYSRSFLRDVFKLVRNTEYTVGKLFSNGIEAFDAWHPELERYFEANFVLLRRGTWIESLVTHSRFDISNTPVHLTRDRDR